MAELTFAELFADLWDPDFKRTYLDKTWQWQEPEDPTYKCVYVDQIWQEPGKSVSPPPSSTSSLLQIPPCHLPNRANNFSVSNYVVEDLYSIRSTFGDQRFICALSSLMSIIPPDRQDIIRNGIMKRMGSLQKKRNHLPLCAFCKSTGRPETVYRSHTVKSYNGLVLCPYLREYTCPVCHASGDNAHTIRYCPRQQFNLQSDWTQRIQSGPSRWSV